MTTLLTTKLNSVHSCVQVDMFAKFEEISSRCFWDIMSTRMGQMDNPKCCCLLFRNQIRTPWCFKYLVPHSPVAGNIQGIYRRCVCIRARQCAGLLCVACQRVRGPCFVLSAPRSVHSQTEPIFSAPIPVKEIPW